MIDLGSAPEPEQMDLGRDQTLRHLLKNSGYRVLSLALIVWLLITAAEAAPVRLVFQGVIQPGSFTYDGATDTVGDWDGLGFSGDITFDPLLTVVSTDDSTFQLNTSYLAPALMSLRLNLPNGVFVSGDGMSAFAYLMELYRNYANPVGTNALLFNVDNHDYFSNGLLETYLHFDWEVLDRLGTASPLFSDPNGGISYAQAFNLQGYAFANPILPDGQSQAGYFQTDHFSAESGLIYSYRGYFSLTSLEACSPFPGGGSTGGCFAGPGPFPAPEPAGIALVAAGLVGLGLVQRRRQRLHMRLHARARP